MAHTLERATWLLGWDRLLCPLPRASAALVAPTMPLASGPLLSPGLSLRRGGRAQWRAEPRAAHPTGVSSLSPTAPARSPICGLHIGAVTALLLGEALLAGRLQKRVWLGHAAALQQAGRQAGRRPTHRPAGSARGTQPGMHMQHQPQRAQQQRLLTIQMPSTAVTKASRKGMRQPHTSISSAMVVWQRRGGTSVPVGLAARHHAGWGTAPARYAVWAHRATRWLAKP